ncbi:MAG: UpxY family transcription antiterminator [Deltaproteobacteria bacterium]
MKFHIPDKNGRIIPGRKWHAIYTLYRHEKKVAGELMNKGIETYVPLAMRIRRYNRKIKRYEVPLISNYVFIKVIPEQYITVLNTFGVIKFIKNLGKISVIPEIEINYLRLITGEVHNIEAENLSGKELSGKEIMITEGPLIGLKAKVVDKSNNNIIIVTLDNVGYAFKFEVDPQIIKFI